MNINPQNTTHYANRRDNRGNENMALGAENRGSKSIPHTRLWTAANLCTGTRVAILPALVSFYLSECYLISFFLLLLIGFSDILDGWIARRTNTASACGAVFDVVADCAVVFTAQGFLLAADDWPAYMLVLSLLSIASFSLRVGIKRRFTKTFLGRYTGAVLLATFSAVALCKVIHPSLWRVVNPILVPPVGAFLILSAIENLMASSSVLMAGVFSWMSEILSSCLSGLTRPFRAVRHSEERIARRG